MFIFLAKDPTSLLTDGKNDVANLPCDVADDDDVPFSHFGRSHAVCKELLQVCHAGRLLNLSPNPGDVCAACADLRIVSTAVCKSAAHVELLRSASGALLMKMVDDPQCARWYRSDASLGLAGHEDTQGLPSDVQGHSGTPTDIQGQFGAGMDTQGHSGTLRDIQASAAGSVRGAFMDAQGHPETVRDIHAASDAESIVSDLSIG